MPALNQRIAHWKGDSAVITIPVKDKAGNWVSLSGASARWWMGKSVHAAASQVLIQKSTESFGGLEITNPAGGSEWDLVITLDPIDTENIESGTYYHEAEIVDSQGNISTVTTGPFELNPTLIPDAL